MTSTRQHETEIVADAHVPMVVITREFDATPDKLYRAYTDPELVARWLGPRAITTRIDHWDCRTGGSWRYSSVWDGGEAGFFGTFHEVRPDRLVQTFTFDGFPDGVALETVTFEDLGEGRTLVRTQTLVDSFESRDAILSSGMDVGVTEGYQKLDEIVAAS
ncbi:MAG: SRPBCC family protein [Nakamurella sp.]